MHNLHKKAAARHVLTPSILAVRQLLHRRAALHVSVRNFPWECLIWMRIRIIQSNHCFRMKTSLKNSMISLDTCSDLTYDTCEIRRVLEVTTWPWGLLSLPWHDPQEGHRRSVSFHKRPLKRGVQSNIKMVSVFEKYACFLAQQVIECPHCTLGFEWTDFCLLEQNKRKMQVIKSWDRETDIIVPTAQQLVRKKKKK